MSGHRVHLSRFTDDTKVGEVLTHQRGMLLNRGTSTEWMDVLAGTSWKFSEGKYDVQHWERSNPMHQNILRTDFLENTSDVKNLGIVVDTRLNTSQYCARVSKVAYGILACVRQSTACTFQHAVVATAGILHPVLGLVAETQAYWRETNEGRQK